MKKLCIAAAIGLSFASPNASADDKIRTRLTGYQEVPSVSTVAAGEFEAILSRHGDFIDFELSYQGLQGEVRQAHIHFAQRSVNGAIVVWLCQTVANPAPASVAARVQPCPQEGTVRGRINPEDVVSPPPPTPPAPPAPQQITEGELGEVIAAIRSGVAYVNVHTDRSPGGEIRGQIGKRGAGRPADQGRGHRPH
jgi:hypothetical protein